MSEKTNKAIDGLIEESGLKLSFIAEQMSISRQRLYDIRVNPLSMGIDQMEKLAEILGVDFTDIYKASKKI